MRKILFTAGMLLLLFAFAACAPARIDTGTPEMRTLDREVPPFYEITDGDLKLTFYPATTLFTLTDTRTGEVWESNPFGYHDPTTTSNITTRVLQSLLVLEFSSVDGATTPLDSAAFSVNKGFYDYGIFDNGFEVYFTITNAERRYYIPHAVPEWRMDELMESMTEDEITKLRREFYRLYDIDNLRRADDEAALLEQYPSLAEENIYVIRDTLAPNFLIEAEELFAYYGYTAEDYLSDREFFETVIELTDPIFNVTLRIELNDNKMTATVPFDQIQYLEEYPPVMLRILPNFGAGGLDDEGFIMVPDGSGALINFNNGKHNQTAYNNSLYGWDEGLYREAVIMDNRAHFPVFGIERNNNTFICIIEQGASYANARAAVSGMTGRDGGGDFNIGYFEYVLIHREELDISAKSDRVVTLFERNLPPGEAIVQTYHFSGNNGFVSMAETYREYLMEKYPHLVKQEHSQVPVAVEIIGAVNKIQHIAGLPIDRPFTLTTYRQATDIVNDLNARGFEDVDYRLIGWFNGSVLHSVPSRVRLISSLGSRRDLQNLVTAVNNNNRNSLFMEADFLYMRDTNPFDGFSLNTDAARYINRRRIETRPHSFIWFGEMDWKWKKAYIARPTYMMELIDGFIDELDRFGAENIAFRTIGNNLAGDYNERRLISREASLNMQTDKLRELHANGTGIMIQSGYAYAMPFADIITELPLNSQGFGILDEEIPFYQIAIHGLIPYTGRPMNLAEDFQLNLLRSLETGAGLYFNFMHESPAVLQGSRFQTFYANQYETWADTAQRIYQEFNEQVGDIYNQFIVDYRILSNGVSVTEYENGVKVVINKSNAPFVYDGNTVNARDYLVLRGGR
jgi:hypothetical protein